MFFIIAYKGSFISRKDKTYTVNTVKWDIMIYTSKYYKISISYDIVTLKCYWF